MSQLDFYLKLLPSDAGRKSPNGHRSVDVVEMCGGMGGVLRMTISRNLVGGENVDLRCNWNLLDPSHNKAFWSYLKSEKPTVVVMAPPCTAFNALAQLFKHKFSRKFLNN